MHVIYFAVFGSRHYVECYSLEEAQVIWDALNKSPDIHMCSKRP